MPASEPVGSTLIPDPGTVLPGAAARARIGPALLEAGLYLLIASCALAMAGVEAWAATPLWLASGCLALGLGATRADVSLAQLRALAFGTAAAYSVLLIVLVLIMTLTARTLEERMA